MPGVNERTALSSEDNGVNKLYITAEETQAPEEAKVEGKLPSYITGGKYLRVGPSKFDFKDFTMNHWLDGYALLSKFEIKDDSIVFEKKYVESDAYKRANAIQKPAINEFNTRAQNDGKSFFARVIATLLPEFTDNSYSTLFQLGSDLFATCDTQYFHKLSSNSLRVESKCCANQSFKVNGMSAHPITDPNTGDVYNIGFTIGAMGIKYHLFKIPSAKTSEEMMKKAQIITSISPRWSGKMGTSHSFGMTENYVVLVEQPCTVSTKRIAASFVKGDTLKDWLEWSPDEKNRFYIVDKKTGKVFKTEFLTTSAFYYLHFINCYEDSNQIVVDIVVYDSPSIMDTMTIKNLRQDNVDLPFDLPFVKRFIVPIIPDLKVANVREDLNLVTKEGSDCVAMRKGNKILITGEQITKCGIDLPTLNKRYFAKKAKYAYAAGTYHNNNHNFRNSICKVNLETKETLTWKMNPWTYPGEALFVPDPKGTEEDDGVLIAALTDRREGHDDFLIVLDAKNLTELGRAKFTNDVPAALHGIFLPN